MNANAPSGVLLRDRRVEFLRISVLTIRAGALQRSLSGDPSFNSPRPTSRVSPYSLGDYVIDKYTDR
jgi:hypothetical protein